MHKVCKMGVKMVYFFAQILHTSIGGKAFHIALLLGASTLFFGVIIVHQFFCIYILTWDPKFKSEPSIPLKGPLRHWEQISTIDSS